MEKSGNTLGGIYYLVDGKGESFNFPYRKGNIEWYLYGKKYSTNQVLFETDFDSEVSGTLVGYLITILEKKGMTEIHITEPKEEYFLLKGNLKDKGFFGGIEFTMDNDVGSININRTNDINRIKWFIDDKEWPVNCDELECIPKDIRNYVGREITISQNKEVTLINVHLNSE